METWRPAVVAAVRGLARVAVRAADVPGRPQGAGAARLPDAGFLLATAGDSSGFGQRFVPSAGSSDTREETAAGGVERAGENQPPTHAVDHPCAAASPR